MLVTQITTIKNLNTYIFSADFIFDKPYGGKREKIIFWCKCLYQSLTNPYQTFKFGFSVRKRIWFEVPHNHAKIDEINNAFYLIALPMAIAANEDLIFRGDVDINLLKKTREIEKYYHEVSKRKIKIFVQNKRRFSNNKNTSQNSAQFFTMGVDSFFTLLCQKNQKNNQHLVYVDGFDIPFYQRQFLEKIHHKITKISKQTENSPIFVSTNLRLISDSVIGWGRFHVSALVAIYYFLNIQHIQISGESFEAEDWGLRFGVDKLYSSKNKTVELIAHNVSRDKKISRLIKNKQQKLFLENVRVCWENVREKELIYNCSECQKCLKTKLTLTSLNIENTPTFQQIKIKDLEKIHLVGHVYEEWQHLYQSLKKLEKIDNNILLAIEKVLEKPLRV